MHVLLYVCMLLRICNVFHNALLKKESTRKSELALRVCLIILVFFLWALCNWSGKSVDDSKLKQLVRWATLIEHIVVRAVHYEKSNAFTPGLGIQRQIYQNVKGAAENLISNHCSWEIPINKKYHNVSQKSLLWTLPHRLLSKKKTSNIHMTQPQPRIVCGSPK